MTLHRWTPRELAIAIKDGRILELVPRTDVELNPIGGTMVEICWPTGPRGHAIVGLCPQTCHFVAEFPASWRTRGRAIAAAIPWPHPDLVRRFESELRS
jgi:hypothetical protein